MIKKYKHISFDLDGTLVHTIPDYRHRIVSEVIATLGGRTAVKKDIDKFWFDADRDEVVKKKFGLEPDDFWLLFRQLDVPAHRSAQTFAYDEAEACFRKLKDCGKTISVITGAPENIARMEIAKLNGAPVDILLALAWSDFPSKPAPDGLRFVLNELKMDLADTVYIGNGKEDADFARNAGVDFIYLERQPHDLDFSGQVIKTIRSLEELII